MLASRDGNKQGVSQQAFFFYWGWGIYERTTVKPPKIKAAATVQITDEGTKLSYHCL